MASVTHYALPCSMTICICWIPYSGCATVIVVARQPVNATVQDELIFAGHVFRHDNKLITTAMHRDAGSQAEHWK